MWAIYVAATFAASGFSFSGFGSDLGIVKLFLALGFWAFTIGHLGLMWQTLKALESFRAAINKQLLLGENECQREFIEPLKELTKSRNPFWVSATAHTIIDLCVTLIIFST